MGEKKKPQLDWPSPEVSQGDSDSESTSVSSSMQSSISSATSSLDQESSNVKGGTRQKKTLNKSISKKLSTFGSFMSSRRRAQSRLSQSSIKLSDEGSTTPPDPSSIEVSDESSNNVQKHTPKFTRTGSLRSVKIFRSKSKNKSSFKPKKSSIDKTSEISEESHLERATFSSTLKDSKFPEHLKHQAGPLEPEEVLPVAKLCPYQHCSLHGHHHHHEPPKRFAYLKRRTSNDQKSAKPETKSTDKSSGKKREAKVTKKIFNRESAPPDVDFSIEFYAKTRSQPLESYGHDDAEFADILFGVNSLEERSKTKPVSDDGGFVGSKDENDGNLDGSKSDVVKKPVLKKGNHVSMWHMIHQHMVSGLAEESGDEMPQQLDHEKKLSTDDASTSRLTKDFDDAASQETEIRKMFAIKLVREAIEKILLPEVQDDQSTTSEVISEQNPSENSQNDGQITSDPKAEPQADNDKAEPQADNDNAKERSVMAELIETKTEKRTPKSWSYLKKVILLNKFVKELEKVKKFNPKKPRHLPLAPEPESETVSLRRQKTGDKKNADEWMLDYALQKVVSELAPTQKKKVALLVKAFETVAPAHKDDSRSNAELQRVGSETKVKFQEMGVESKADFEVKTTPIVGSSSVSEQPDEKKESRFDFGVEKEKHIKLWHMIYQHVATDIAMKIGSDLLLDGEESTNSEEKNLQEVEEGAERKHGFRFNDAVKLVRESVDEILLQEIPDNSSQETQSVASDVASDHEEVTENVENDFVVNENKKPEIEGSFGNRLLQQKSKNWSKLKKLILLKRSIKALEGFRKVKPETRERKMLVDETEEERVELRRQMMDERKKAEQWMLDYAVQHIVTKLTPARKKRVSMLVEAFEAVVPLPEI